MRGISYLKCGESTRLFIISGVWIGFIARCTSWTRAFVPSCYAIQSSDGQGVMWARKINGRSCETRFGPTWPQIQWI